MMRTISTLFRFLLHPFIINKSYKIIDKLYTLWYFSAFNNESGHFSLHYPIKTANPKRITIGNNSCIGSFCMLEAWTFHHHTKTSYSPSIKIGNNCHLGEYSHITAINDVSIGNNVLTGRFVLISDNSHGDTDEASLSLPPMERPLRSKGSVVIEDDVWIGDKVTILSGVTIGKGSVIAANSVVTRDVPAYSVAGGIPAKILKQN